jgi:hypothetical protein
LAVTLILAAAGTPPTVFAELSGGSASGAPGNVRSVTAFADYHAVFAGCGDRTE